VVDVRLESIRYPLCEAALLSALGPSPADEPMPLVPGYLWSSRVGAFLVSEAEAARAMAQRLAVTYSFGFVRCQRFGFVGYLIVAHRSQQQHCHLAGLA
jgi:hypothetical protein